MTDYTTMLDDLSEHSLEPAVLDALAWARVIAGTGNFSEDKHYLAHFTGIDKEDVQAHFANLVSRNSEMLQEDAVEMLLPDEKHELADRLRSISSWCGTFLSCLGISEHMQNPSLVAKIKPNLSDLMEISKLDTDISGDYDTDEMAELDFMELYEHLRMTVLALDLEIKTYGDTDKILDDEYHH